MSSPHIYTYVYIYIYIYMVTHTHPRPAFLLIFEMITIIVVWFLCLRKLTRIMVYMVLKHLEATKSLYTTGLEASRCIVNQESIHFEQVLQVCLIKNQEQHRV